MVPVSSPVPLHDLLHVAHDALEVGGRERLEDDRRLAGGRQLELHLELDVRGRHREQPVRGRLLEFALAAEDVEEAHGAAGYAGWPWSCDSRRCSAAIRFSIGGCVANRPPMPLPTPAGKMKNAFSSLGGAQVLLRDPLHAAGDLHQRAGQRARPAGDQRRAAVGRELAVARQRLHQEERDHVDDERDQQQHHEARAVVVVGATSRRRRRSRTGRCRRRSWRRSEASVITITSRLATWVSSWAMTPSSSAGESSSMMPGGRADGRVLGRAAERERVRHRRVGDGDLRLRQVGLHAQPVDHRVQLRRLLRRDDAGAHRGQRELVRREQVQRGEAADDDDHEQSRSGRRRRAARRRARRRRSAEQEHRQRPSGPAVRCPCRKRWVWASHERFWQARAAALSTFTALLKGLHHAGNRATRRRPVA